MLSKPRKVQPEVTAGDTSNQNQREGRRGRRRDAPPPSAPPPPASPALCSARLGPPRGVRPAPEPPRSTARLSSWVRVPLAGASSRRGPRSLGSPRHSEPKPAGRRRLGPASRETLAGTRGAPPQPRPGRAARPSGSSGARGGSQRRVPGGAAGTREGEASPRLTRIQNPATPCPPETPDTRLGATGCGGHLGTPCRAPWSRARLTRPGCRLGEGRRCLKPPVGGGGGAVRKGAQPPAGTPARRGLRGSFPCGKASAAAFSQLRRRSLDDGGRTG